MIRKNLIVGIKPGPKPKANGEANDRWRGVKLENKPKHPNLRPHKHKSKD